MKANLDYILNGVAHGPVATRLLKSGFDVGAFRPYLSNDPRDPRTFMTLNQFNEDTGEIEEKEYVTNANATLTIREWQELDTRVIEGARPRLQAVGDLRDRGLVKVIPNGMGKTVFQYQTESFAGSAAVSMDGLRKDKNDRPIYDVRNLPLPIIHADWSFTARELATSRERGGGLDFRMASNAGRRVAELAEQMLIGTWGTYTYGGGTIYGYTNWPDRATYTLSDPADPGWVPKDTMDDVAAMRQLLRDQFRNGPYVLYTSQGFGTTLDDDYSSTYPGVSLRDRIMRISGISAIRELDFLTGTQMLLVEMSDDVVREIIGMEPTTLEWPTEGGMELNYKTMLIMVPQLLSDFYGRVGIVHGAV